MLRKRYPPRGCTAFELRLTCSPTPGWTGRLSRSFASSLRSAWAGATFLDRKGLSHHGRQCRSPLTQRHTADVAFGVVAISLSPILLVLLSHSSSSVPETPATFAPCAPPQSTISNMSVFRHNAMPSRGLICNSEARSLSPRRREWAFGFIGIGMYNHMIISRPHSLRIFGPADFVRRYRNTPCPTGQKLQSTNILLSA